MNTCPSCGAENPEVFSFCDTRWSPAEAFELAGRGDEAKASLGESVEIAERYGHLVTARARERLEGAVK